MWLHQEEILVLLCFCEWDRKWKSLLSGQQIDAKTPIAPGKFSQNDTAFGLQDPGLTKQNQNECAGSGSGNANAGNSNYFFWF